MASRKRSTKPRGSRPSSSTRTPERPYELLLGDCMEAMRAMPEASVDAVVTDPPYSLGFMGKGWDNHGGPSGYQEWTRLWAAGAYRVLKPGGHLLSFSSPRTYHRMACGVEEAGFEIRDSLHWIFGSGFPKSLDVSKAIDAKLGAEREVKGYKPRAGGNDAYHPGTGKRGEEAITEPATAAAAAWDGWGTALKPAHEPIVLARKPLAGSVAENVLEHGTGALHVAATEVGTAGGTRLVPTAEKRRAERAVTSFGQQLGKGVSVEAGGRWPANVMLSHLPECEGTGPHHTDVLCASGCPVAELNEMSGTSVSQGIARWGNSDRGGRTYELPNINEGREIGKGDRGGAARFFYIPKPDHRERIGGTLRNLHPTVKPVELMRWLVRLVTPPGGLVLDPFLGSGTTGCAAMVEGFRFIGCELEEEYFEIAKARIADWAFAHGRLG